jgi:4-hydroxy-tetrahydrodipicolinate synthase
MRTSLEGVIPILPTPFTDQGEIDEEGFARVTDAAIASGVDGVAMFGLASEYYKLADAERDLLAQLLVNRVAKRCQVILSVTAHSTHLAVAESKRAAAYGADALMLMPPFFLGTPISSIVAHIQAVASAVSIPIVIQYAPLQTGRVIDPLTFTSICRDFPNIKRVKVDLVPSGPTVSALSAKHVSSLVGYMGLHLPEDFTRGAVGVMPTVSIAPAMVKIWQLLNKQPEEAKELHSHILPFLNFVMQSVEFLIACEKELLVEAGIMGCAICREPGYRLDGTQRAELQWHKRRLGSALLLAGWG